MHGSLGDPDSALDVLLRASAAGAWWHHSLLVQDDDLAALREVPEFKQLVELSPASVAPLRQISTAG